MATKNSTGRLGYIDAMRGFCMYLVVYAHVVGYGYHTDGQGTFKAILVNFYLVLFFFISGFVAYKNNVKCSSQFFANSVKNKFIQLVIPSVVFCALYVWWDKHSIGTFFHIATSWYWFTVQLFEFFLFYYLSLWVTRNFDGIKQDVFLFSTAIMLYLLGFSHTIIQRTPIGAALFSYLGMECWRDYIFFILGVFTRKHFELLKRLIGNSLFMAVVVLLFFFMVFYADHIDFSMWKPMRLVVYGGVSIIVIFAFFFKYHAVFSQDNKFGQALQFIGGRTLDVYMIHYFLLPRHLDFVGNWLTDNPNPTIEFFLTTIISIMVITLRPCGWENNKTQSPSFVFLVRRKEESFF